MLSRKRFRRLAYLAVSLTALWLLCSFAVAHRYVARAQPIQNEPVPSIHWGNIHPVRFTTDDGEQIGTWFIDGQTDHPVVLFLHGNGSCRSTCLGPAEMLAGQGYSVLMLSLRAHGDSTGQLNDFGYRARLDVLTAVKWVEQNKPGRPIVVWGQSLGSAAAVFAANDLGKQVGGYILECPYRDLRTAVWNRLAMRLPPPQDHVAYAGLLTVSPLVLSNIDQISPVDAVSKIPASMPVLILAGSRDQRAPASDARAIQNRIADHSELIVIEGADHLQLQTTNPTAYQAAISDFLTNCGKGKNAP